MQSCGIYPFVIVVPLKSWSLRGELKGGLVLPVENNFLMAGCRTCLRKSFLMVDCRTYLGKSFEVEESRIGLELCNSEMYAEMGLCRISC